MRRIKFALCILVAALSSVSAIATDMHEVTEKDRKFIRKQREEWRNGKEYRKALREVEELERTLKEERRVPYDNKIHKQAFRASLPPSVNPALRRAQQPNIAVVVYDISGAGRVINMKLLAVGPNKQWGEDAMLTLGDQLYEPLVEGDVGITRTGVKVAATLEFDGEGQKCDRLGWREPVDEEARVCVTLERKRGQVSFDSHVVDAPWLIYSNAILLLPA